VPAGEPPRGPSSARSVRRRWRACVNCGAQLSATLPPIRLIAGSCRVLHDRAGTSQGSRWASMTRSSCRFLRRHCPASHALFTLAQVLPGLSPRQADLNVAGRILGVDTRGIAVPGPEDFDRFFAAGKRAGLSSSRPSFEPVSRPPRPRFHDPVVAAGAGGSGDRSMRTVGGVNASQTSVALSFLERDELAGSRRQTPTSHPFAHTLWRMTFVFDRRRSRRLIVEGGRLIQ
jgi:hypothetical protein